MTAILRYGLLEYAVVKAFDCRPPEPVFWFRPKPRNKLTRTEASDSVNRAMARENRSFATDCGFFAALRS
jgi:hypothetical protein